MRIVQIIDSLEVGGAERMAINYANALSGEIIFSGLVATRAEGDLKSKIHPEVDYLFLNRKRTIDFKAIFRLKAYCKKNKIQTLQPHSSSYFMAFLVKLIYPKIKIIWHDHNGLSEFLGAQKWIPLKIASFGFKGIIVVNHQLKKWAIQELYCKNVICLPNFTNQDVNLESETVLKGQVGKRIVCLANLRSQKNHFLLIKVAEKLKESHPDWSFHLIGKDFNDDYSQQVNSLVLEKKLNQSVFLYGSKNDGLAILNQSDIGILTSKSEGLPVALLEYGLRKMPVVVTQVGEIPLIIKNNENGFIVSSNDDESFYKALVSLIENPNLRLEFGQALYETIIQHNSEEAVIANYLNWMKRI